MIFKMDKNFQIRIPQKGKQPMKLNTYTGCLGPLEAIQTIKRTGKSTKSKAPISVKNPNSTETEIFS